MSDARIRLAEIIGGSSVSTDNLSWRISIAAADRILSALNLTPAAALALMEGKATVVPNELTGEMLESADDANSDDWDGETDPLFISEPTRRIYTAAITASPYRSDNDD